MHFFRATISAVGGPPDARPGEIREDQTYTPDAAGRQSPADARMDVIGINKNLEVNDFWGNLPKQGGPMRVTVNLVPGMNAFARLHDYWFNSGTVCCFTYTNIPSMIPAIGITYAAIVGGPASVTWSLDQDRYRK